MTHFDPQVARSLLRYEVQVMCAGVSHAELGKRLGVSRASFTQLITGRNLPSQPALEVLAYHFGQRHRLPFLISLLRDARAHRGRSTEAAGSELAEGLGLIALAITAFDPCTVNPALRTPAYSAALGCKPPAVGEAAVTWFAEEQALRRPVGGEKTMCDQFEHLIVLSEQGRLTLRVIPATSEPVPGLVMAFTLFVRDDGRAVVHEETNRSSVYSDSAEAITAYRLLLRELDAKAWDAEESVSLLRALRRGSGTGGTGPANPVSPVPGAQTPWSDG